MNIYIIILFVLLCFYTTDRFLRIYAKENVEDILKKIIIRVNQFVKSWFAHFMYLHLKGDYIYDTRKLEWI